MPENQAAKIERLAEKYDEAIGALRKVYNDYNERMRQVREEMDDAMTIAVNNERTAAVALHNKIVETKDDPMWSAARKTITVGSVKCGWRTAARSVKIADDDTAITALVEAVADGKMTQEQYDVIVATKHIINKKALTTALFSTMGDTLRDAGIIETGGHDDVVVSAAEDTKAIFKWIRDSGWVDEKEAKQKKGGKR